MRCVLVVVVLGASSCDPVCGSDPSARLFARVLDFESSLPLSDVELTLDVCPDISATSDVLGGAALRMEKDRLYVPMVRRDGYMTMMTGEQRVFADFDGGGPMFSNNVAELFPHVTESSPGIVVLTAIRDDALPEDSACRSKQGITFSVVDHPEAIITYYRNAETPELDESLTETSALGAAHIGGLSATTSFGDRVQLVGEKEGCEMSFDSYPHTGRYALADGVLTAAGVFVPPIPPPLR
jgi:hypothetical protein